MITRAKFEGPWEKTVINMFAENIAVNFHFGFQIQNIGNIDIFNPVWKRTGNPECSFCLPDS